MTRGYQYEYSKSCDEMHSVEGRQRKAATMVAVLSEALGARLGQAHVLNLGCSAGIIDEYVARSVVDIVGVDIDAEAIAYANARKTSPNTQFRVDDAMNLSFADSSFDVVICSQVYEHVPDAARLMQEINRVLKPGGVVYFAATNKWVLMEPHHHLPFLSWLPPMWADRYMRWAGKGDSYYEHHVGYADLQKLAAPFRVEDYTAKMLLSPELYGVSYIFSGIKLHVARLLYRFCRPIFPGYIWLLWKRAS